MDHSSSENTDSIPLHRVAVVRPFAQFLADVGMPVEQGFRQAGLPYTALEDVNNFVPSHRFWSFLINAAHSQHIEDLGFRVGEKFGARSGDPKMTHLLRQSPTMHVGLLRASELLNKTISHCQIGLIQPRDSRYTLFFHSPSCDADNPAIGQIGWFGLTALMAMVRAFAGPKWHPTEVGVMTRHAPGRYIREQLWGTRIRLSQSFSYIALENALLALPPLTERKELPAPEGSRWEPRSSDFAGSLKQVLRAYLQEDELNVEFAAALCNTSTRSLQRRLKSEGTPFSTLLDQARFDVASRMLRNPDVKVVDVAQRLSYSDPTHFARAFRRVAGITPKAYQQAYAQC